MGVEGSSLINMQRSKRLMKTVQNCYALSVGIVIVAVALFAYGLFIILSNPREGCEVCVSAATSLLLMPLTFVASMAGLVVALVGRGETRSMIGGLSVEEQKRLECSLYYKGG